MSAFPRPSGGWSHPNSTTPDQSKRTTSNTDVPWSLGTSVYLGINRPWVRPSYEHTQRTKGNISDRFSGQQFGDYDSELRVISLEPSDSAAYLRQQLGTALQGHQRSVHKPPCFALTVRERAGFHGGFSPARGGFQLSQRHVLSC